MSPYRTQAPKTPEREDFAMPLILLFITAYAAVCLAISWWRLS